MIRIAGRDATLSDLKNPNEFMKIKYNMNFTKLSITSRSSKKILDLHEKKIHYD